MKYFIGWWGHDYVDDIISNVKKNEYYIGEKIGQMKIDTSDIFLAEDYLTD
jgi:hypothetical protein